MALMLFVVCVTLWLLVVGGVGMEAFSCFVLFVVLLLCLLDPFQHCGHLVVEEGAGCG